MFAAFFYLLRQRGLDVSINEWITLLEGLEKGLHHASLTGFYHLCRAIVVKSEREYDRFDQAFALFFRDAPFTGQLPEELLRWLDTPDEALERTVEELRQRAAGLEAIPWERQLALLEQRLAEQTSQHNGGSHWIGTQGNSPFGNSGWRPDSLRVGGEGRYSTAVMVASQRRFRDFREDNRLSPRQFQMAFRLLRQMSVCGDDTRREVDVDGTIHATSEHGGVLQVQYRKPRKNAVKVLLLMDSGGSMELYAQLCSQLFQAATRCNHFKELHTYYFHNCIFRQLYETPELRRESGVSTEWVLQNYDSSYKVIIVGDARMNPYELRDNEYDWVSRTRGPSGLAWLERFRARYPYLIWLNPEPTPAQPTYWRQTHYQLAQLFEMYQLTYEGLRQGMKRLMVRR